MNSQFSPETLKSMEEVREWIEKLEKDRSVIAEAEEVDHPSHYQHPSGIECIEIVRHENFNRGNAIKYIWRAGLKGHGVESAVTDLKKAVWYIEDEIKRLENSK